VFDDKFRLFEIIAHQLDEKEDGAKNFRLWPSTSSFLSGLCSLKIISDSKFLRVTYSKCVLTLRIHFHIIFIKIPSFFYARNRVIRHTKSVGDRHSQLSPFDPGGGEGKLFVDCGIINSSLFLVAMFETLLMMKFF
jgi:hypothetical protein